MYVSNTCQNVFPFITFNQIYAGCQKKRDSRCSTKKTNVCGLEMNKQMQKHKEKLSAKQFFFVNKNIFFRNR